MKIVNLTQHQASAEQIEAGVYNLTEEAHAVREALTFSSLPTQNEIVRRAEIIAGIASTHGVKYAMIGGAPYLMGALEKELKKKGIQPLYSFSERVSVESVGENGEVIKTSVFQHKGWVQV